MTRLAAGTLMLGLLAGCVEEPGSPEGVDQTSPSSTSDAPSASPTDAATANPSDDESTPTKDPGTRVVVAVSDFGPMLFDETGQAIYLFDVETSAEPACYEACAKAWPPVLTRGSPVAGRGVKQALLGTAERTDGRTQVTYGGHPLYFYAHEDKNEVKCHDVFLNGGSWYVVQPDGDAAPPG